MYGLSPPVMSRQGSEGAVTRIDEIRARLAPTPDGGAGDDIAFLLGEVERLRAETVGHPTCESCGLLADVRLDDGSTWCTCCHFAAKRFGLDQEVGTALIPSPGAGSSE